LNRGSLPLCNAVRSTAPLDIGVRGQVIQEQKALRHDGAPFTNVDSYQRTAHSLSDIAFSEFTDIAFLPPCDHRGSSP